MTSDKMTGLVLGGVLPAVLLGLFGFLQKVSIRSGMGPASMLICAGLSITVLGLLMGGLQPSMSAWTTRGVLASAATGGTWFVAVWMIAYALMRFDVSISQITPLYNMNTLVVVVLGLVIFAEWRQSNPYLLVIGALLVVTGGAIVSRA